MAIPEKVLTVIHVRDGKAWIDFQAGLKGVVSSIQLAGEATGQVRVEIEDCPALVESADTTLSKPSNDIRFPEPDVPFDPGPPIAAAVPPKKKRGRPKKNASPPKVEVAVTEPAYEEDAEDNPEFDIRIPVGAESAHTE